MSSKPPLLYYGMLNYQPSNLEMLDANFEVTTLDSPAEDTDEILAGQVVCCAPLGFLFDATKMDRMPKLRVICSNTTSVPHVDEKAAAERGIRVISLREEIAFLKTITPTAEHTWALMLAVMRNIPRSFSAVLGGEWTRWPYGSPQMLSRMSFGIAGLGRIGGIVARYAKAFGMPARYYDPYVKDPGQEGLERVDTLEELVSSCDVISLHLHLTPETRGMFDKALFTHFKQGSWLINTSRGAIVDNNAMIAALESGQLAGAATDVLDDEFEQGFTEAVRKHPLVRYAATHNNLVITPHIAGSTVDAWTLTQKHTIVRTLETLAELEVI